MKPPTLCAICSKNFMTLNRLTITFIGLLLTGLLIQWWLFYFSGLDIPWFIPNTPIDLRGLLLIVLLLIILITFIKSKNRHDISLSIVKLTLAGTLVCFVAELVFQFIKLLVNNDEPFNDRITDFYVGVLGITLFAAAISFLISFQIKTKKTGLLLLFIAAFLALIVLIRTLLPLTVE
jgi:cytochrome bd-type quinol oxidase subunit 2